MKAYRVETEITTKWVIEVHGKDETEVTATTEGMDNTQIEAAGDFVESVKVEVVDVEMMYPEDEDQDDEKEEFVDLDSLKASEGSSEGGSEEVESEDERS